MGYDAERALLAVERFKFLQRHLLKKNRKFQRRAKPLIRRLDRAILKLSK